MKEMKTVKQYGEFMFEYWKWVKKYWQPKEQEWDSMVKDAGIIMEKYPENLCRNMILAFMADRSDESIGKGDH
jgi:hypothetical protein